MMALNLSKERSIMLGRAVGIFTKTGLVDAATLNVEWANNYPIARLYGNRYAQLDKISKYSIPEPKRQHQREDTKS